MGGGRLRRALVLALLAGGLVAPAASAVDADLVPSDTDLVFSERLANGQPSYDEPLSFKLYANADVTIDSITVAEPFEAWPSWGCDARPIPSGSSGCWVDLLYTPWSTGYHESDVHVRYASSGAMHDLYVHVSGTARQAPPSPTNLSAHQDPVNDNLVLTWDPPAGAEPTGYRIFVAPPGTVLDQLDVIRAPAMSWTRDATPGTSDFSVSAVYGDQESAPAPRVTITLSEDRHLAPWPPQDVTAALGTYAGQVVLTWSPPADNGTSDALSYEIRRGPGTDPRADEWTSVGTTTRASISDVGVPGGTWSYTVTAVTADGRSEPSGPAVITVPASTAPSVPRDLTASIGPNIGQVSLTWTTPQTTGSAGPVSYDVVRWSSPGTAVTSLGSTPYLFLSDSGRPAGTTWTYGVTARTPAGSSPQAQVTVTMPTPPGVPQNVTVTAGSGRNTVTWSAPGSTGGSAITGYRVYRSTNGGAAALLATVTGTTSVDTALARKTTYAYAVAAVNGYGVGPLSGLVAPQSTGGGKPRR